MPNNIRQIIKGNYLQPAFLICAGILLVSASTMSMAVKLSGIYLKKEPLPLKKPLSQLDSSNLFPYKIVEKHKIENQDIVETLGTEDYIQWNLEDTSAPPDSDVRLCSLFITYYGIPDKVPHVPDECYIGGGFQRKSSEEVALKINTSDTEKQIIARYIVFEETKSDIWGGNDSFAVFYIFSVNSKYAAGREDTRLILNENLFGKFSYFSKVEWKFYNKNVGRASYPNKQEALAASEKLLSVILPVLEREYWPGNLW